MLARSTTTPMAWATSSSPSAPGFMMIRLMPSLDWVNTLPLMDMLGNDGARTTSLLMSSNIEKAAIISAGMVLVLLKGTMLFMVVLR